jgi:hypothetical protein
MALIFPRGRWRLSSVTSDTTDEETAVAADFTGKITLITDAGRSSAAPSRSGWPTSEPA